MKLYEVPNNTRIRVITKAVTPPFGKVADPGDELLYHHPDGMYSYCTNDNGDVIHLAGFSEVEIVK
jgi:hypothetical protein